MATIDNIKLFFETGDKPTQEHFYDLINRLVFFWDTDIVADDDILLDQLVEKDGTLYKCTTAYNVGAGKTFTVGNFEPVGGDLSAKVDKDDTIPDGNIIKKEPGGGYEDAGEHSDTIKGISNNFSDFTTLRTLSTVNLEAGDKVIFKNTNQLGIYQIKLGTDIESPPDIIHTNDYNATTNAKVLERVFVVDGFVEVSDVDVSGISEGDNILLLVKRVSGSPQVSDSIVELTDRLSTQTTNLTNATWTSGTVTGITGVPGQYTNDTDYEYFCIGTDEWLRRPIVNDKKDIVTFIAAEKTESELITEYPDAIAGQLFATTSYLYACVGDDLFRQIKTKDRYITTTSHPTLTSNLDAHDFATNGWYDDTTSGSNETTVLDDRYVDTTNEIVYEKVTDKLWREIS